jgi:hypothetical protein
VWRSLGLDALLIRLLGDTRRDPRVERVLFGLVAARAIEPASKLATAAWLTRRTHIAGLTDGDDDAVSDDECYRAMDWLIETAPQVEKEVFWSVASLLNLDVDLLLFDTTSTYFEVDDADEPGLRDERGKRRQDPWPVPATEPDAAGEDGEGATDDAGGEDRGGFRIWGKSQDFRGELPQIVIGMAVTREGIPVRVWCWPNAVAFTVAEAGSLEQSPNGVALHPFRASSSDTSLRAA